MNNQVEKYIKEILNLIIEIQNDVSLDAEMVGDVENDLRSAIEVLRGKMEKDNG